MSDIKKNRDKILTSKRDMGMKKKRKTMEDKELDQAFYLWFKQKRMEGVPVTALGKGTGT